MSFLLAMQNKREYDGGQPSCYLIYFLVQKVDTKQDEIFSLLKAHNNVMYQQMEEDKRQANEIERSNKFLQQICFSVTPNSRRQECFK